MAFKRYRGAVSAGARGLYGYYMAKRQRTSARLPVKRSSFLKRRLRYKARTTRGRARETYQPHAEYTKSSVSLGRRRPDTLRTALNVIKANEERIQYSMNGYSEFGGTKGFQYLVHAQGVAASGIMSVPCHIWDLNSVININTSGVLVSPDCKITPYFTTDDPSTATVAFATNTKWALTQAGSSSISQFNYPMANAMWRYVNAKLIFYAPLTTPSRISVRIVRFKKDWLCPNYPETSATQLNYKTAMWQGFLKPFTWNPLETGTGEFDKMTTSLYRKDFIMNPKETTETSNTIFRELNIFMRTNRSVKFDWQPNDRMAMDATDSIVNIGDNGTNVTWQDRTYLIITGQARMVDPRLATALDSNGVLIGTGFNNEIHPSYDIKIVTDYSRLN